MPFIFNLLSYMQIVEIIKSSIVNDVCTKLVFKRDVVLIPVLMNNKRSSEIIARTSDCFPTFCLRQL